MRPTIDDLSTPFVVHELADGGHRSERKATERVSVEVTDVIVVDVKLVSKMREGIGCVERFGGGSQSCVAGKNGFGHVYLFRENHSSH